MRQHVRYIAALAAALVIGSGVAMADTARAEDVLYVLSVKTAGYQEMISAANSTCGLSSKIINLAENSDVNLAQMARITRAKVVVAVGDKAYKMATSQIQRTPVYGALVGDQRSSTISYIAPPERYVSAFKKIGRRNVGLIYSSMTASYVRHAVDVARSQGVNIVAKQVSNAREAVEAFNAIKGSVDGMWLLPDTQVLSSASAEAILRGAQEKNLPVVAFSQNYLKQGAAAVIEPDRTAIGRMLGEGVCTAANNGYTLALTTKEVYHEFTNDVIFDKFRGNRSN